MEPDIEAQIAQEIFAVLERLGAEPELLSIISHSRDTLDDREVFWMLRECNTTGRVPQTGQRYGEAQRCTAGQRCAPALRHAAPRLVKARAAVPPIGALPLEDAAYTVALRPGPASTKRG